MLKIQALEDLVTELSRLPGVGPKSAERLAYHILRSSDLRAEALASAILRVKSEVKECRKCFNYTTHDECYYCQAPERTAHIICVVEEPSAIERIEQSGVFKGRYHVLHGAIAPLLGITPQKLKIQPLIDRVKAGFEMDRTSPQIDEIIFALDADLEGDTTILYISQQLKSFPVKLSRLAQGVPIGSGMTYLDERTLGSALQNRVEIEAYSSFDRE
jgi:recombination protein RecR